MRCCRKKPTLSIIIPFRDDGEHRTRVWQWLKRYWKYHLPGAEIVVGHDDGTPFSKAAAINEAASRARGRVFVIADADACMDAHHVKKCVSRILHARKHDRRLWFIPYTHLYRLTEEVTLELLETDPHDVFPIPTPPPCEWIEPGNAAQYGHRFGALMAIMPREAFFMAGGFDVRFRGWGCTDEKTEIFTATGWKHYTDVAVGDSVLTLNHETGLSEWKPVQKMNVYEGTHEMLSIESKTHSSLTTLNHRWPVIRKWSVKQVGKKCFQRERRDWATSEAFGLQDYVPIAAECADLPTETKYQDALVECVGWFWTEGHIARLRDGRMGRPVEISQSMEVNADKCELITSALTRAFGPESEFPRRGKSTLADIPRWRMVPDRRNANFVLNAEAGEILQQLAPGRVPTVEFLTSLTKAQLELFIEASMLADGHTRARSYERVLAQKDPAAAEAYQFALILAGYPTANSCHKVNPKYGYGMSAVSIRQQRRFKLAKGTHQHVTHEGVVWCPTTENGTWLARRNGKVYFTGNSEDAAFMRAVDTLYAPHELAHNDIFHLWHERIGDTVATRKWVGQVTGTPNGRLSQRYGAATGEPGFMRQLVDEHVQPRPLRWARFKDWPRR